MNEFEYVLAQEKLKTLTTKKAKGEFLSALVRVLPLYDPGNFIALKMLIEALNDIHDLTIPEYKRAITHLSRILGSWDFTEEELGRLGDIPKTPFKNTRTILRSNGVPPYIKLQILKEQV